MPHKSSCSNYVAHIQFNVTDFFSWNKLTFSVFMEIQLCQFFGLKRLKKKDDRRIKISTTKIQCKVYQTPVKWPLWEPYTWHLFHIKNIIHKPFDPQMSTFFRVHIIYIQYLTEHKINKTSIQKVNHTSPVTGFFPYFFKYGTIFLATEEDLCKVHVHLVAYLKH